MSNDHTPLVPLDAISQMLATYAGPEDATEHSQREGALRIWRATLIGLAGLLIVAGPTAIALRTAGVTFLPGAVPNLVREATSHLASPPPGLPSYTPLSTGKVFEATTAEGPATFWATTTAQGCAAVSAQLPGFGGVAGGSGCVTPDAKHDTTILGRISSGPETTSESWIWGMASTRTASVEATYADGSAIPSIIDNGYFLLRIPALQHTGGVGPEGLTVRDGSNHVIDHSDFLNFAIDGITTKP
jgi:hypothetical protein